MNEFLDIITKAVKREEKTKPYDTTAKVTRIDGDTAWVHIDGGVDETPVRMTINASEGDTVQVRVGGGTAFLVGNGTAPPTDDRTANFALGTANTAQQDAQIARQAAESAEEAAGKAWEYADSAHTAATTAWNYADQAHNEAVRATGYANDALTQLSTVEDVVDTLNWITEHGTMTLTTDTAIDPAHVYFVVDPNGDYIVANTHYRLVTDPKVEELSTYYVLSIDEAVSNYVASHLALTDEGLYVVKDNQGYKVLLSNTGLQIQDDGGHTVATFGESITFDSERPQTIGSSSTYLKWYDSNGDYVADTIEIAGNVNIANNVTIGAITNTAYDGDNLLTGTYEPVLGSYVPPKFVVTSGGDGTGSIGNVNDSPVIGFTKSFLITGNTSGNKDFRQNISDFADLGTNGSWVFTAYARSTGASSTALIRVYSQTALYSKSVTVTSSWTKISLPITLSTAPSGSYTSLQFGISGAGGIEYIAPRLVRGNISLSQRVYYRSKVSGTVAKPTEWITNASNKYNDTVSVGNSGWSTKVTPIASSKAQNATKYLYLYTCEQRKAADGTYIDSTAVTLDENTTVIDGGTIITGTVNANAVNASSGTFDTANIPNLNANKITAGDIAADRMKVNSITAINSLTTGKINAARLDVGSITVGSLSDGNNYSTTNQMNNAIGDAVDSIEMGGENIALEGTEAKALTAYNFIALRLAEPLEVGQKYTLQLWGITFANTPSGNDKVSAYWGGSNVHLGDISSLANGYGYVTFTPSAEMLTNYPTDTKHTYINLYNTPPSSAKTARSITIERWKLEKGNKPTAWSPSYADRKGGVNMLRGTAQMMSGSGTWESGTFRASGGTLSHIDFGAGGSKPREGISGLLRVTNETSSAVNVGLAQDRIPTTGAQQAKVGYDYTLSCFVRCNSTAENTLVYLQPLWKSSTQTAGTTPTSKRVALKTFWQYISYTGTLAGDQVTDYISGGYVYAATMPVNGYMEVCALKLEFGTSPSAWSAGEGEDMVTRINNTGIAIHPASDYTNRAEITADGMNIYKSDVSVAQYGDTARIGTNGGQHILVDTDSVDFYSDTIHELSMSGSQTSYLTEGAIEFAPNTNTTSIIRGGRFNSTGSVYDGEIELWTSATGTTVKEASIKLSANTLGDSECRIEADEININNEPLADYVIYQGTSGIWTYREWKSGIAECWGTYTDSIAVNIAGTAYGGYRSDSISIPTFPLPFATAPTVTATMNTPQGVWVNNVNNITTTGGKFYLSCGSSLASASRSIAFHVIGQAASDPT